MNTRFFSGLQPFSIPCIRVHLSILLIASNAIWGLAPLSAAAAEGTAPPGATKTIQVDGGSLFSRPFEAASVIDTLRAGERVTLLGKEGDWCMVRLEDQRLGWVHQRHTLSYPSKNSGTKVSGAAETKPAADVDENPITTTGEPPFRARVKVRSGRVRKAPTTNSPIIDGVQRGDIVSVEDTRSGWYFIRMNGDRFGWAHQSLLSLDAGASQNALKRIEAIRFEEGPSGEEKIIFSLNGFYPPKTFALDEQVPKVACDFLNTRMGPELGNSIPVGGDLVRKIRIGQHEFPQEKVRVVIELAPDQKYSVEQVFYKKTNRYTLTFERLGFPAE